MKVRLNATEMMVAGAVGTYRRISSLSKRHDAFVHTQHSDWNTEMHSVAAEMAYAKWSGRYWPCSVNTYKEPDVGGIQVRSTTLPHGKLIIRENDGDDEMFAFLRGSYMDWDVVGGLIGRDGKRQEWWVEPPIGNKKGCWYVPESALFSIDVLAHKAITEIMEMHERGNELHKDGGDERGSKTSGAGRG